MAGETDSDSRWVNGGDMALVAESCQGLSDEWLDGQALIRTLSHGHRCTFSYELVPVFTMDIIIKVIIIEGDYIRRAAIVLRRMLTVIEESA